MTQPSLASAFLLVRGFLALGATASPWLAGLQGPILRSPSWQSFPIFHPNPWTLCLFPAPWIIPVSGSPFPLWSLYCFPPWPLGPSGEGRNAGLCQGGQRAKGQLWAGCLAWASGWAQCLTFPRASLCVCSLNIFSLIASRSGLMSALSSLSSLRISIFVYLDVFSLHSTCCLQATLRLSCCSAGFPSCLGARCGLMSPVDAEEPAACPEGGNGPGRPGSRAVALGKLLSVALNLSSWAGQIPGTLPPSCLGVGAHWLSHAQQTGTHPSFLPCSFPQLRPEALSGK